MFTLSLVRRFLSLSQVRMLEVIFYDTLKNNNWCTLQPSLKVIPKLNNFQAIQIKFCWNYTCTVLSFSIFVYCYHQLSYCYQIQVYLTSQSNLNFLMQVQTTLLFPSSTPLWVVMLNDKCSPTRGGREGRVWLSHSS